MTYFMVDIEADGPVAPLYSMVSLGVVVCEEGLGRTFFGKVRPISELWLPGALAVSGYTREETLGFPPPERVMPEFIAWVLACTKKGTKPIFVSDNNGFDFGFVSYYLWRYTGGNIFGHSSRNLSDLYKGMTGDVRRSFRHLKKTPHTHHPVDDAKGNAEALLAMRGMGLKIKV